MQLSRITNNQLSQEANAYFLSFLQKKGYTITGKSIKIGVEQKTMLKDLTAAGNWFMITNSAVAPTAALNSPLYIGDLRLKTFVQAFTSGTLDRYHGLAQVDNAGAAVNFLTGGKKAIGAVEAGDPSDAAFNETFFQEIIFNDAVFSYGVGSAPIGTIRCQIDFQGFKISLV